MPDHLYAVIFEQGTVKVGQSVAETPMKRIVEHKRWGEKFGIAVAKYLTMEVSGNLTRKESALCGYCAAAAVKCLPGAEWYKFHSPAEAEKVIELALENIKNDKLGDGFRASYFDRAYGAPELSQVVCDMVIQGMDPYEAADKVGIRAITIIASKWYKELVKERKFAKSEGA